MGQHVLPRKTQCPTKEWRDARVLCALLQIATCFHLLDIAWLCGERASAHAQPELSQTQAHCFVGRLTSVEKVCAKLVCN